jgi:hypothetical protein
MLRSSAVFFALICPLLADPLSQQDRERVLQHLERTRKIYLDAIAGVTPAQWTFKPAPDRWSIAECAEHIVTTEEMLMGMVQKMTQSPAPAAAPEKRATDDGVLAFFTDRSQKFKAPEVLQPKAKYPSPGEVRSAFEKVRAATIEYARSTQDDLRGRFGSPSPRGAMDAYQYLLMIAGHAERHSMQMDEVKQSPGYPK